MTLGPPIPKPFKGSFALPFPLAFEFILSIPETPVIGPFPPALLLEFDDKPVLGSYPTALLEAYLFTGLVY